MASSHTDNHNEPIETKRLLKAILSLADLLGIGIVESIITSLQSYGIYLNDDTKSYSLHEIKDKFDIIFGNEASELIFQRLEKEL